MNHRTYPQRQQSSLFLKLNCQSHVSLLHTGTLKDMDVHGSDVLYQTHILLYNSRVPEHHFAVKIQCLVHKKNTLYHFGVSSTAILQNPTSQHITCTSPSFLQLIPENDSFPFAQYSWEHGKVIPHSPFSLFHFLSFSRIFLYLC